MAGEPDSLDVASRALRAGDRRHLMPRVTQRDVMRRIFRDCRGDHERSIAAYAQAERRGEVERKNDRYGRSAESYARALLLDGLAKGWRRL